MKSRDVPSLIREAYNIRMEARRRAAILHLLNDNRPAFLSGLSEVSGLFDQARRIDSRIDRILSCRIDG